MSTWLLIMVWESRRDCDTLMCMRLYELKSCKHLVKNIEHILNYIYFLNNRSVIIIIYF